MSSKVVMDKKIRLQSVRNGISNIHQKNPGVTINAAAYEYARKFCGIHVFRYLEGNDKLSLQFLKNTGVSNVSNENGKRRVKRENKIPDIPFLSTVDIENAEKMKSPYFVLYLLENSIREFINKKMTEKYGPNWWNKINLKPEIIKDVKDRIELEKVNKWHARRGSHEIFYTDLEDLPYFLNKERGVFDQYLDADLWTTYIKKIVKLSRNIVNHHNPLPSREIKRLETILEDWKKQLT